MREKDGEEGERGGGIEKGREREEEERGGGVGCTHECVCVCVCGPKYNTYIPPTHARHVVTDGFVLWS